LPAIGGDRYKRAMETPWLGDACSLVDAFRRGERSPADELEAVLAAIDGSQLNAFSYVATEEARDRASRADVRLPFGGVPIGVKELDRVEGWPATDASLVFKDRISSYSMTYIDRLDIAGAVRAGLTTASEFGGLNVSVTRLNGVTANPWDLGATAGGSSGGSAAAVAGGIVPLATGGDGGGSIRIPAGFCGLVGLKTTAGRIPRGPNAGIYPLTSVLGCLARSVRDTARFLDVAAGYSTHDPYSLPAVDGWERRLGSRRLRGRATIAPTLGAAIVADDVQVLVEEAGAALARAAGLELVDVPVRLPNMTVEWAMAGQVRLLSELGDRWPACVDDLTPEIAFGLRLGEQVWSLEMAERFERVRTEMNEAMAAIFDEVDVVISATNPDVAFPAEVGLNVTVDGRAAGPENNGALTIPANIVGNPAISIPSGEVRGLPVGVQVIGRHHEEALLLDLALIAERERPWPLVAPGAPR
jgi:Asp-tRNA(Asn)/Glu-tRNA(Gln) amidotransferase A subunit family amidase